MPKDYQGDALKCGDRVLVAYALGVLREGLIVGVRADGKVVAQFSVSVMDSPCEIPSTGCLRISNE